MGGDHRNSQAPEIRMDGVRCELEMAVVGAAEAYLWEARLLGFADIRRRWSNAHASNRGSKRHAGCTGAAGSGSFYRASNLD